MNDTHPYTVFSVAGAPPAQGGRRLVAGVMLAAAVLTFGPHALDAVFEHAPRTAVSQDAALAE